MASSSDFEVFLWDENESNQPTLNTFSEGDIDVSEISSVSNRSSDDDVVDNADDAVPVEWLAGTTPVAITPFTQPTDFNHQLADNENALAYLRSVLA